MAVQAQWLVRRLVREGVSQADAEDLAAGGDVPGVLARMFSGQVVAPGGATLAKVQSLIAEHAALTTNVHGIVDTSELVDNDDVPDLTLIYENGLI